MFLVSSLKLLQAGYDGLKPDPQIFDGVEIAALGDPVQDADVLVFEPGLDGLGGVAGGTILHEDAAPCDVQAGLKVPLEDPLVHFRFSSFILAFFSTK